MIPSRSSGLTAVRIITYINIFVFIAWKALDVARSEFMYLNFLVSWSALVEGRFWTLLTSVFSHNMLFHIFINMMVLSSFGPILEKILGAKSFVKFYLVAGIVSSLSHAVVSLLVMHSPNIFALGASGAISGLVMLFSLMFPKEKLQLLFFIPIPALFGIIIVVGLDLLGLFSQAYGGSSPFGHGAHLGGAFTGLLYYFLFIRGRLQRKPSVPAA